MRSEGVKHDKQEKKRENGSAVCTRRKGNTKKGNTKYNTICTRERFVFLKFVDNVATKTETKVKEQEVENREMHDRGGLTCQRCVNLTEVEGMAEAERKKRENVRVIEDCYHVRGGCMLQAWRGTSRSTALGRGVPVEVGTDGGVHSSTCKSCEPHKCRRACTVELVRTVEVVMAG